MLRMRTLRAAPLIGLLALGGCYTYAPTLLTTTRPGESVRLYVSESAQQTLGEVLDTDQSSDGPVRFRGTILSREGDRVLFQVPVTVREEGLLRSELGQNVWLSSNDVVLVERRRLDTFRTGLMVGLTAGAAAALIHLITVDAIRPATPDPGAGDGLDESRIPLFRLTLP
jgi:hypothetical protein